MTETLAFGLLAFTSLFTLINPLGTMPVFMAMTSELTVEERNRTARNHVSYTGSVERRGRNGFDVEAEAKGAYRGV